MAKPKNPMLVVDHALPRSSESSRNERGRDLGDRLAHQVQASRGKYKLIFETGKQLQAAEDLLWGLCRDPKLFQHFPTFNNWKVNPLAGVESSKLKLLKESYLTRMPPWIEEPRDTVVRLLLAGSPVNPDPFPVVFAGMEEPALHLAFLSLLENTVELHGFYHLEDRTVHLAIWSFFKATKKPKAVFSTRVPLLDPSSDTSVSRLKKAEVASMPAILVVPGTLEGHSALTSKVAFGRVPESALQQSLQFVIMPKSAADSQPVRKATSEEKITAEHLFA